MAPPGLPAPADRYQAFLLDLDGVVYRGQEAIPGTPETVAELRDRGRRVVFLTNNSARTPERVAERLVGMGIPATPEEVVTSAQAAAAMVAGSEAGGGSEAGRRPLRAFVVGEEGVRRALADRGVEVTDGSAEDVDVVVVGWDRSVDYDKLRTASVLVGRGARLVATNTDASYPAPGGELWPGAGALVAAVETATGVPAEVAGKPERPLFEEAVERAGSREALVVGDRVETDIAGALAAGLDAAVVFSGAAAPSTLLDRDPVPHAALDDLGGVLLPRAVVGVRPAAEGDDRAVHGLLEDAGLADHGADAGTRLVAQDGGEVLATAGLEVAGEEVYLRGVAVRSDVRGMGLGPIVVAGAVRRAAATGGRRVFLVTEDAEGFFRRLGFRVVSRESLPGWIRERAEGCPASASAMAREVAPPGERGADLRG